MPIYFYQCSNCACGNKVEELRPMAKRNELRKCPQCKKGMLHLIITGMARTPNKWGINGEL